MCEEAIELYFDRELYDQLMEEEAEEKDIYVNELKEYVNNLKL